MYQAYFKLTGKPFRLSPDPGFFFPSRGHKRALAYLRYGLKQDEGFVVITGAPGTGKTTLAKILLNEMGDSNVVVAHLTTTQLNVDDMLRMVASAFGLHYEGLDKAALIKSLESYLLARSRERKRALLVIDEAQNLPATALEELRMLSNLQAGDKALMQIFLLGQEQFRSMLDHKELEQFRQRVIANFHLTPLAADESQRYIESRLSQVGWSGDPSFAEVAFEKIYEYAKGVPHSINMLCDRVLLHTCMEERHQVTGEIVQQVIAELDSEISDNPIERLKKTTLAAQQRLKTVNYDPSSTQDLGSKGPGQYDQTRLEDAKTLLKKATDRRIAMPAAAMRNNAERAASMEEPKHPRDPNEPKTLILNAADRDKAENQAAQMFGNFGNTAAKKQPVDNSKTIDSGSAQNGYSDRDLFRVISGGKQNANTGIENSQTLLKPAAAKGSSPSAEDVVLRRILRLVLAFHRSPSRFPGLDSSRQPLPEGITELLELAIADDLTLTQVSPAAVMGISPVMLRAAVRFFVRRALFLPDADDYRVLGLQNGAEQPLIEKHYDLLMRLLRQDKQRGSADSVARIGEAYEALSRADTVAVKPTLIVKQNQKVVTEKASNNAAIEDALIDESLLSISSNDQIVIGDGDLTIDFNEVTNGPTGMPGQGDYSAKHRDVFSFEDGVAQKRMRYAGQMAVLGFGALVIVLGMYIVQLEPSSDDDSKKPLDTAKMLAKAELGDSQSSEGGDSSKSAVNTDDQVEQQLTEEQDATRSDIEDLLKKMERARVRTEENKQQKSTRQSQQDEEGAVYADPERAELSQQMSKTATRNTTVVTKQTASELESELKSELESEPIVETEPTQSSPPVAGLRRPAPTRRLQPRRVETIASIDMTPKETSEPSEEPPANDFNTQTQRVVPERSLRSSSQNRPRTVSVKPAGEGSTVVAGSAVNALAPVRQAMVLKPPVRVAAAPSPSQPIPSISPRNTASETRILNDFSNAYSQGDINKLMALFTLNARTNNQTSSVGIRADYIDLFQSTSSRKMTFSSLQWDKDQGSARGLGRYTAVITPKGGRTAQTFTGKVTMQVESDGGISRISRFYFTNEPQGKPTGTVSAKGVTRDEINKLITSFVENYETGKINELMDLFAPNARTNDQVTLAGIRKDHDDLFKTTAARQMFIKNMNWKFDGDQASGEGNFEVLVQAKGQKGFTSIPGKISIKMQKVGARLKFTHLFHNTQ